MSIARRSEPGYNFPQWKIGTGDKNHLELTRSPLANTGSSRSCRIPANTGLMRWLEINSVAPCESRAERLASLSLSVSSGPGPGGWISAASQSEADPRAANQWEAGTDWSMDYIYAAANSSLISASILITTIKVKVISNWTLQPCHSGNWDPSQPLNTWIL